MKPGAAAFGTLGGPCGAGLIRAGLFSAGLFSAGLLSAGLLGCGGQSDEPPAGEPAEERLPGEGVVHTPPPNADSLHRVRAQLHYGDNPAQLGFERVPLGGWNASAVLVMPRVIESVEVTLDAPDGRFIVVTDSCDEYVADPAFLGCEPRTITVQDDVRTEAVVTTDVNGTAVFWLEQPGPYRFSSDEHAPPGAVGCWWSAGGMWDGTTPEVMLEIGLSCT
jgi:hypothetical protein